MAINLLPQKEFSEKPFWQQALKWTTTGGRVIIIGTEIIVLGVFFSRFFLDRRITDLSEEIRTKKVIIKTTGTLEERFRKVQDRLSAFKDLKSRQNQYSAPLNEFPSIIPPKTVIKALEIKSNNLKLTVEAGSSGYFTKLLTQILNWEDVQTVALKSANLGKEGEIEIFLDVEINPESYAHKSKK